mmetsp:Transcript_15165/g.64022  ORF Transcript_15165/g.64022 Transcript_15165/m.64022 type:complete len:206 (+) Transcript_15165:343-960(+)
MSASARRHHASRAASAWRAAAPVMRAMFASSDAPGAASVSDCSDCSANRRSISFSTPAPRLSHSSCSFLMSSSAWSNLSPRATFRTYLCAHQLERRSTSEALPKVRPSAKAVTPQGVGTKHVPCAACMPIHMTPPIASGSHERDCVTCVYVVRCSAIERSQAPQARPRKALERVSRAREASAPAAAAVNRSGDPNGPAAIPLDMS